MPLYMDRHYIQGVTADAVADAHRHDLAVQDKYRTQFLTYWVDEARCTVFCLVSSPDKESLQQAHDEAHGLVPNEIVEVDPSIVGALLGRVQDPPPVNGEVRMDSAFRAIMFTDLKDSTQMTARHGDQRAMHLVHVHNALTRGALKEHNGREVKHTGDGMMASFATVIDAVDCGVAIQKAFAAHNAAHPGEAMHLRVGIAAGEPIEEAGDLFGRAVQLAARICAHSEPDRVLVGEMVRDGYAAGPCSFRDVGEITPKGFDDAMRVYEVRWDD